MSRLIDAGLVMKLLIKAIVQKDVKCIVEYLIDNGVEIRKKGEWKWYMENGGELRCSDCMGYAPWSPDYGWRYSRYCPDCGADMRRE